MRALWVTLLLAATVLAGCSDEAPPPEDDLQEIEVTDDTGGIRGVVVDAAIRPLSGVTVTVKGGGIEPQQAATADDGSFTFSKLPPGTYFLIAEKIGYFKAQQSTDVVAGVADPKAVRILLESNPEGKPSVETFKYDGFIECGYTAVALRHAVCSEPNAESQLICAVTGSLPDPTPEVCLGNFTNDRFLPRHAVTPEGISYVQSEMEWDSTQATGERMNPRPGYWNPETGDWDDLGNYEEVSPIIMKIDEKTVGPIEENGGFQVRVFSSYMEGTAPAPGLWGVGATVQQEFVVITNVFHNFEPAEGWTYLADGPAPVPK